MLDPNGEAVCLLSRKEPEVARLRESTDSCRPLSFCLPLTSKRGLGDNSMRLVGLKVGPDSMALPPTTFGVFKFDEAGLNRAAALEPIEACLPADWQLRSAERWRSERSSRTRVSRKWASRAWRQCSCEFFLSDASLQSRQQREVLQRLVRLAT